MGNLVGVEQGHGGRHLFNCVVHSARIMVAQTPSTGQECVATRREGCPIPATVDLENFPTFSCLVVSNFGWCTFLAHLQCRVCVVWLVGGDTDTSETDPGVAALGKTRTLF